MVNVSDHNIVHYTICGGLAPAVVIPKKKKAIESHNTEEEKRNTGQSTIGLLCKSCTSCEYGKCYFAYRDYPRCYLVRG